MIRKLFLASLFIGSFVFLLKLLGENGLQAYFLLKEEIRDVKKSLDYVEEETLAISSEIRLLRSNIAYILKQAKSRTHFLDKDEILYIFETELFGEERNVSRKNNTL